jgi:hypothetical protein
MWILVGGGTAVGLVALYVVGRWTLIQVRRRAALLRSFYREETQELVRRVRAWR